MRKLLFLPLLCMLPLVGCGGPLIKTQDITFFRADGLNDGQPAAVDIIYPRDARQKEEILEKIGPEKWFTSEMYDKVHKDKDWLEEKSTRVELTDKDDEDEFMIIFVQFSNPDPAPPRGQDEYLVYIHDKKPKPRKHEYIFVHDGSMERLKSKSDARKAERRSDRDDRDRKSDKKKTEDSDTDKKSDSDKE